MPNFNNEISKEFYKMQIENFAMNLMSRADDILEDWDKGIKRIHIEGDIALDEILSLKVTKEYAPRKVDWKGEYQNA